MNAWPEPSTDWVGVTVHGMPGGVCWPCTHRVACSVYLSSRVSSSTNLNMWEMLRATSEGPSQEEPSTSLVSHTLSWGGGGGGGGGGEEGG